MTIKIVGEDEGSAPILLKQPPTDAERATELRARAKAHLELFVELANQAEREGLRISFSFVRDTYGRNAIGSLDIIKVL